MWRLAAMIDRIGDQIEEIHVCLESRHAVDINHPRMWQDRERNLPPPTVIRADDLDAGIWTPQPTNYRQRIRSYLRELEDGNTCLMIEQEHCVIGTVGHAVWNGQSQAAAKPPLPQNPYGETAGSKIPRVDRLARS